MKKNNRLINEHEFQSENLKSLKILFFCKKNAAVTVLKLISEQKNIRQKAGTGIHRKTDGKPRRNVKAAFHMIEAAFV